MYKIYHTNIETNELEQINEFEKGSWINLVNPTENEIQEVCENINIQDGFIKEALDFEERARIDVEEDDDTILFVVAISASSSGAVMVSRRPSGASSTTLPFCFLLMVMVIFSSCYQLIGTNINIPPDAKKNKIYFPNFAFKCINVLKLPKENK